MNKFWLTFTLFLAVSPCFAVETFSNPVDGKVYSTEKWRKYKPDNGVTPCHDKVCLGDVRLLQSQTEIAERTTAEQIARLIEDSLNAGRRVLASQLDPLEVLVQFTCEPSSHKVEMAYQGHADEEALQLLYNALGDLPPIATSGKVLFQFTIRVAP